MGQAFAEALARRGTHLLLMDGAPERLRAWATWLSRVNAVQVDLMRTDLLHADAAQVVDAAAEQTGRWIDVLITNAGCGMPGRWEVCWRPCSAQPVPFALPLGPTLSPERMVAQAQRTLDQHLNGVRPGRFRALLVWLTERALRPKHNRPDPATGWL
jgi:NAD(P)-dependent dehydrogenase (short-subunit alcohol dehydrogenase family)